MANHGTATGGITTTATGRFGRAGDFNGSGWVEVPDAPSLRPTGELTVAAWVNTERIAGSYWPGYVTKRIAYQDQPAFSLHQGETGQVTVDVGDEADRFISASPLSVGTWTHVAFVFNSRWAFSERVRLYLDGTLARTGFERETTIPASTAPLTVGNLPGGGSVFEGRIDEVAVWRRALSGPEVALVAAGALAL